MARIKQKIAPFNFKPFSNKQKQLISWWKYPQFNDFNIVIADGAIRAGKTVACISGFLLWSQATFQNANFAIVGKSMSAVNRNVVQEMKKIATSFGWKVDHKESDGTLTIGNNIYYIFGAPNEKSQDVIQGLTLYGSLVDEVALIPESFWNQLLGRHVSIDNHRIFCNCNPSSPIHWFKQDWIDKAKEKNILYLQFELEDNLTLSQRAIFTTKKRFTGVFYDRYILGKWVNAENLIFTTFNPDKHVVSKLPKMLSYYIAIDYGQSHDTSFILLGVGIDNKLYIIKEYAKNESLNSKFANDYDEFVKGIYPLERTYCDPGGGGKSLHLELQSRGYTVNTPIKDVIPSIQSIQELFNNDKLYIYENCQKLIKQLQMYSWDTKAAERGEDKPLKINDDLVDAFRYVVYNANKIEQI